MWIQPTQFFPVSVHVSFHWSREGGKKLLQRKYRSWWSKHSVSLQEREREKEEKEERENLRKKLLTIFHLFDSAWKKFFLSAFWSFEEKKVRGGNIYFVQKSLGYFLSFSLFFLFPSSLSLLKLKRKRKTFSLIFVSLVLTISPPPPPCSMWKRPRTREKEKEIQGEKERERWVREFTIVYNLFYSRGEMMKGWGERERIEGEKTLVNTCSFYSSCSSSSSFSLYFFLSFSISLHFSLSLPLHHPQLDECH